MKKSLLFLLLSAFGLNACDCPECAQSLFKVSSQTIYVHDGPTAGSYILSAPLRVISSFNWSVVCNAPTYISLSVDGGVAGASSFAITLTQTLTDLLAKPALHFDLEAGQGYEIATLVLTTQQDTQYVKVYYQPTLKLSFDANGGGANPASITGQMFEALSLPVQHAAMNGPDAYSTLTGWSETADGSSTVYPVSDLYTLTSSTKLFAIWLSTPPTYSVTYHANDGSGATETKNYYSLGGVLVLENTFFPAPSGLTFYGWGQQSGGIATPLYAPFAGLPTPSGLSVELYAKWTDNSGSDAQNPLLIYNEAQLRAIGSAVGNLSKHYLLMDNIALAANWTPIGNKYSGGLTADSPFTGSFTGNGHTISNLTIPKASPQPTNVGLFGEIKSGEGIVAVQDLHVELGTEGIHGTNAGGIVGTVTSGTIRDCLVSGGIVLGFYIGGVAGNTLAGSDIIGCKATVGVTSVHTGHVQAGGIVGKTAGRIKDCYATGNVSATGGSVSNVYAGGITGWLTAGSVKNCYATGSVNSTHVVGGIVGVGASVVPINNCVALNPEVSSSTGEPHRVLGFGGSAGLSNNHGLTTMTGGGAATTPGGADGADCPAVPTADWWTGTALWDDTVWVFANGALPKLKWE